MLGSTLKVGPLSRTNHKGMLTVMEAIANYMYMYRHIQHHTKVLHVGIYSQSNLAPAVLSITYCALEFQGC